MYVTLCLFVVIVVNEFARCFIFRYPIFLSDPLTMHPPAEDNYGVDACSLLCLSTTPSTLVVATAAGFIYHCVVLDQEGVDGEIELDVGGALQQTLYVYEGIDLEFGDINEVEEANQLGDDRQQFDDIGFLVLHEGMQCLWGFLCVVTLFD